LHQQGVGCASLEIIDSLKISAKELDSVIFDITAHTTYTNSYKK